MHWPLENRPGTSLPRESVDLFRRQPTLDVTLADGTAAIAVTRQCDVRTVLSDNRFSRAKFHTRTVCARSDPPLALATTDPPTHTMRRRAVQGWFTTRRAEQARPLIERIAGQLLDDVLTAGPPADVYANFCQPFPNLVHMNLLGLNAEDLPYLTPLITAAWSAGDDRGDEVERANVCLRQYFEGQVSRSRRRPNSGGLIDALLRDQTASRLTDAEIVMLAMGLLMSGAETTASHLALSLVEVLQQSELMDALRRSPEQIPSAVEELLRWIWFGGTIGGTAGQPHVATADVKLHDRLISKGDIVVPIIDVANRDPDAFPKADEFCHQRHPNPHLGFGYGRHRCVGMAFARLELQIGLQTLLRGLDGLALVTGAEILWHMQMFTRGVRDLQVTWRGGGQ